MCHNNPEMCWINTWVPRLLDILPGTLVRIMVGCGTEGRKWEELMWRHAQLLEITELNIESLCQVILINMQEIIYCSTKMT